MNFPLFPHIDPIGFLRARFGEFRVILGEGGGRAFCPSLEQKYVEQVSLKGHTTLQAQKPVFLEHKVTVSVLQVASVTRTRPAPPALPHARQAPFPHYILCGLIDACGT